MAPNHTRHAILEGIIDSFCLVCETYLKCEEEKEIHVLQESHIQHLNAILYVEEFKNDGIRKINNKYYCELCNRLFPVVARVRLHTNDPRHVHKKMMSSIKRVDNYVVVFEEIAISEQSWHGFCENFCAVCNVEYDAVMKHKIEPTHILNLIQNLVTFDKEKNIYRKIDEESCQCLTCNRVIASNMITSHFNELGHKNKLKTCRDDIQIISKLLEHKNGSGQKEVVTCKNVSESIEIFNSDSTMLTKNKPSEPMEEKLETNPKEMKNKNLKNHLNMEYENQENNKEISTCVNNKVNNTSSEYICDDKIEEKIISVLNCTEYITLDENGKTWCILCGWVMNPAKINVHINGEHHKNILNMHKKRLGNLKTTNSMSTMTTENSINRENNQTNIKTKDLNEYETETVNPDEGCKDSIVDNIIEQSTEMNKNTQHTMTKNDTANFTESIPKFEKSGITINLESNLAVCRKCTVSIDFNVDAIENHIVEHNNMPIKKDIKTVSFSAGEDKVVNRKNSLFTSPVLLKQADSEKCKSNDSHIEEPSSYHHDMQQNKARANEKENPQSKEVKIVKPQIKNSTLQKIPCREFITEMFCIKDNIFRDVIINDNLCINFFSLSLLLPAEGMLRCLYCKTTVEDIEHLKSINHLMAMEDCLVITNVDSEFIREIFPGQYHCGYCNVVVSSWDEMEKHLESSSHEECKKSACWRFQGYEPLILRNNLERRIQERLLADLFSHFF